MKTFGHCESDLRAFSSERACLSSVPNAAVSCCMMLHHKDQNNKRTPLQGLLFTVCGSGSLLGWGNFHKQKQKQMFGA